MRVLGRADAGRMPGGSSSDAGRMLDGCWTDGGRMLGGCESKCRTHALFNHRQSNYQNKQEKPNCGWSFRGLSLYFHLMGAVGVRIDL